VEILYHAWPARLCVAAPQDVAGSDAYIPAALSRTGFQLLPISVVRATAVETLAAHHRDPFDRLLVAQGMVEGLPIVSADTALDPYGVRRLW
jgi:PIN domain nuclease of toxin-antitoxin system